MRNKIIQNIVGSVWALGAAKRSQSTPFIHASLKRRDETTKLPRYVQRRKLKTGQIAYYWCPPHWARKRGFPLISESLGHDLDKAQGRIEKLNEYLDNWRDGQKT